MKFGSRLGGGQIRVPRYTIFCPTHYVAIVQGHRKHLSIGPAETARNFSAHEKKSKQFSAVNNCCRCTTRTPHIQLQSASQ